MVAAVFDSVIWDRPGGESDPIDCFILQMPAYGLGGIFTSHSSHLMSASWMKPLAVRHSIISVYTDVDVDLPLNKKPCI